MRLSLLILTAPTIFGFTIRSLASDKQKLIATTSRRRTPTVLGSSFMDDGGSKEESQMNSFVNKFLGKEERENIGDTYLLAIPCDELHELQIELESVQRAIVYNCPVAVHACLPTSGTRIPLMTVSGDVSVDQLSTILTKAVQDAYNDMPAFQFAGLEIESGKVSNNEILHVGIADRDEASSITELAGHLSRSILEKTSYKTSLFDSFRVAFMRLPPDWDELVDSQNATVKDFTPEIGGNGISPLHWFEWSEDSFGEPQRMREIGVYRADGRFPIATIPFPGNSLKNANEMRWQKYQDDRMREVELKLTGKSKDDGNQSNDELMLKLTREKLEKIYVSSDLNNTAESIAEDTVIEENWEDIQEELMEDPQRESDPDTVDDWTRQRIRNVIQAKSKAKKALSVKKDLPPIEENEIFAKFRRGEMSSPLEEPTEKTTHSNFPSREHCTGIWKMNTSPTGFVVEEGDDNRSDNIILRLDGTIAGGPILDQETRQKASGGTWDFQQLPGDGGGNLEIRLVIPPKKERILVMQGAIQRPSELPLSGKTFGIPIVEMRAKAANAKDKDIIDYYGKVWIEDAITKKNRDDVGEFSMTKISDLLDPKDFTITIPKNVRSLD